MSYFQFTKADMREERERGRWETRKEIGDLLAALAHDSSAKLDDDEIDRQTLVEDLITRLVSLSKSLGSDAAPLFESLVNFHGDNPRIPLEDEDSAENTQEIPTQFAGRALRPAAPLPTVGIVEHKTIREAHNAQTFDGYPRHAFERGTLDQFACGAAVRSTYSTGDPVTCNRKHDNAIHDWMF